MIENLENEEWRDIEGYEGYYQISNKGRVKSLDKIISLKKGKKRFFKEQLLKPCLLKIGYYMVNLKGKSYYIHRLVAQAFIPNPDNLPCVNHKNEIKTNNAVENLEWCSYQYNLTYGSIKQKQSENKRGNKHPNWGKHLSLETKKKISESQKGKIISKETREKISKTLTGRSLSEECRKKMSENRRGENHPMWGKHHSEETIKKISNKVIQYDLFDNFIKEWNNAVEASKELGLTSATHIRSCCNGKRKTCGGYKWKYKGLS